MAYGVRPPHRVVELLDQRARDVVAVGAGGHVGDHGDAGRSEGEGPDVVGELVAEVRHVRRVEGAADPQHRVEARTRVLEGGAGPLDVLPGTGDHDLGGVVVVGDRHVAQARCGEDLADLLGRQAHHGGHAPVGHPGHQFAAFGHQTQSGGEIEDTRGVQGVVLAQAVPRHVVGLGPAVPAVRQQAQRVHDVQGGLGELRVLEQSVGVVAAQLLDGIAENLVGLRHRFRECGEELRTHPFVL